MAFIDANPGVVTSEILDEFSDVDVWEMLEMLDKLKVEGRVN